MMWWCGLMVWMAAAWAGDAPARFPGEQYGQVVMRALQSTVSTDLQGHVSDPNAFEQVAALAEDHPDRILGRPVGRLDVLLRYPQGGEWVDPCSAAVVSERYVLTARHCIRKNDGSVVQAVSLVMGFVGKEDEARRYAATVRPVEEDIELDYAILEVEGDPSKAFGVVDLNRVRVPREDDNALIISHPLGTAQRLSRRDCRVSLEGAENGRFEHRCDTLGGSSGAPVFSQIDGAWIGMHVANGAEPNAPSTYNEAVEMVAILAKSRVLRNMELEVMDLEAAERARKVLPLGIPAHLAAFSISSGVELGVMIRSEQAEGVLFVPAALGAGLFQLFVPVTGIFLLGDAYQLRRSGVYVPVFRASWGIAVSAVVIGSEAVLIQKRLNLYEPDDFAPKSVEVAGVFFLGNISMIVASVGTLSQHNLNVKFSEKLTSKSEVQSMPTIWVTPYIQTNSAGLRLAGTF